MPVTYVQKDAYKGFIPCFHTEPLEVDVMGYALSNAPAVGEVVPKGTPLCADTRAKTAQICKYAVIEKKVSTTEFIVKSVGFLAVGDKIRKSGGASESPVISNIKTIDADTRKITLSAANAELAAGDVIYETTSASDVAPKAVPNLIVSYPATMSKYNKTVSAARKAPAILNILNYPAEWLNETAFPGSILLAGNPHIVFVVQ